MPYVVYLLMCLAAMLGLAAGLLVLWWGERL